MEEEKAKKGPLTVAVVMKKVLSPSPSFLAEVLRLSLFTAFVLACTQGGFSVYELSRNNACCEALVPACYPMRPADVNVVGALKLGILACSVPQGVAAALALLLKKGPLRRALAFVALAAATVSNGMYGRMSRSVDAPWDLVIASDATALCATTTLFLLGMLALLMEEAGGDQEYGRPAV